MNNRTVKLASLSPLEASLDRAKLVEEFKRRSNRETNTESRVTNTRVSAFATKSERKKTCVSTNRIHSTLPRVNVSLLQVNEGYFPKKIPKEKPIKRLVSKTNHLKEGGNDMNKARNKLRKWRYKALYEDCYKFKEKKPSSRHSNIYSKGVSRHRKHGSEDNKLTSDLRVNPQEEDIIRTKIGKMEIALKEHRFRVAGLSDLRYRP